MESIRGLKRSHMCAEVGIEDLGKEVTLMGWVAKSRDLGSLAFIDIRDKTGICQLAFNKEEMPELYEKAKSVKQEYVIACRGELVERSSKNDQLPTGDVEVICKELRILDTAKTPPIYIKDDDDVKEDMRLKYRYLDLRKSSMQEMLTGRAEISRAFREFLHANKFIEVETPYLGKPTPEGARDYLVPSRVNAGKFYALPQSPQLYKQLLMIGGTDRYYQIARCFRDEDLRANRQPDFTQVDIEMSFADMEDVLEMNERLIQYIFKEIKGIEIERPFKRISYPESISKYGTDKPDLRYGYEIRDFSEKAKETSFPLFNEIREKEGVYGIKFENLASEYSRKKLDKLVDYIKGIGGGGLLWAKNTGQAIQSSFNKFMDEKMEEVLAQTFDWQEGDLVLIMQGLSSSTLDKMGSLRVKMAQDNLELDPDEYAICWIVDFPLFEYDEEEGRFVSVHHPFTKPVEEDIDLLETDPASVRSQAYDIVINGDERGGGSVRINNSDLQEKIFEVLQLSQEEINNRFGFFIEALRYGTPPHAGIAYGLDRFVMMLLNRTSIRDVIAFPKTQSAQDLMMDAPTDVKEAQLEELHIKLTKEEK